MWNQKGVWFFFIGVLVGGGLSEWSYKHYPPHGFYKISDHSVSEIYSNAIKAQACDDADYSGLKALRLDFSTPNASYKLRCRDMSQDSRCDLEASTSSNLTK